MNIFLEYIYGTFLSLFSKLVKVTPFSRVDKKTKWWGHNRVGRLSVIKNAEVGCYSYIGNNCVFYNCIIGKFCSISSNVKMIAGKHPSSVFVSTHPAFYSPNTPVGDGFVRKSLFDEFTVTKEGKSLEMGNDVWVGSNVIILEGVKIGDGAILAAGSVVVRDVPPYAIVGGVPAKVIKYRFSQEQIRELLDIKWWDKDNEQIIQMADKFYNIDVFLK